MSEAPFTDPRIDATNVASEAVDISQALVAQARSVAAERGGSKQQVQSLISMLEEAARIQERWGRVDDEWRMRLAGVVHHSPKSWRELAARSFHELAFEMLEFVRGWIISVVVGRPSIQQLPDNATDLAVRSLASCHAQVIEWANAIKIDRMALRALIEEERAGAVRDFAGTVGNAEGQLGIDPKHALALLGVVARIQDEQPLPDDPRDYHGKSYTCSGLIMEWMGRKFGLSKAQFIELELEMVAQSYLVREPAHNTTLLQISRNGRQALATGQINPQPVSKPPPQALTVDHCELNVIIDKESQIVRLGPRVCRFGGSELWSIFLRLWDARPAPIDLNEVAGREGRSVASDLKYLLRRNELDQLADAIKNQRGVGYYIDWPSTSE